MSHERPVLAHIATTDMSLALLLGSQLTAFRDAGFDVVGISAPGPWGDHLAERGIEHLPLRHATRAMAPSEDARAFAELTALLRRLGPTIVHTHNPKPGVYGRLAARLAGVPIVVNTVHGLYALPTDPWWKRAIVYGLERVAATASHAELLQNPEDEPTLLRIGVPRRKVQVLGNGIDLRRFDPSRIDVKTRSDVRRSFGAGPDDVLVGAVGRLVREKGYLEFFAAAREISVVRPDVRFVVVGPHEPAKGDAITPAQMADAERETGMRFVGLREDMVDIYGALDLMVLASHREGFPRAAMEAAAMGVPMIATDIRGCRQVVDDACTGVLVPPRNASALADAILEVVDDPERRRAMGRAAIVKASREFDETQQVRTTLDVYRRLMTSKGLALPEGRS